MHHSIRSMTHEDCAAVAALCGQLGYPATTDDIRARFDSITARGAGIVFVAENGGSLVGWIHASVSPVLEADLYGEIAGLVVDASCRSHGVGRTLVKAAEDLAVQRHVHTIFAVSDSERYFLARGFVARHIPELDRERSEVSKYKGVYAKDLAAR